MKLTTSKKEKEAGIIRKLNHIDNGTTLCLVNILQAEIDDYQRLISQSHLNEIASNHNNLARRMPLVSFRDGVVWKVDGNHTSEHLIQRGEHICHCEVAFGLNYEEEADLFYLRNKITKRMAPWVEVNAAVKSGRAIETRMMDMTHEAKLLTPLTDVSEADLRSVSVLVKALKRSVPHFRKFLTVIGKCFRISKKNERLQNEARNVQFQRGLEHFIATHPEISLREMVNVFKNYSASDIQSHALQISKDTGTARADQKQVREALEYFYFVENGEATPMKKTKTKKKTKARIKDIA